MAKKIKTFHLKRDSEPEVIDLINEYASLEGLMPSTAIKRFLLRNLPIEIQSLKNNQPSSQQLPSVGG